MAKYGFSLEDKKTGKKTRIFIEAKSQQEAKAQALRDYGMAYIVK